MESNSVYVVMPAYNEEENILNTYNDITCTEKNWMKNIITNYGSSWGWLLTPYSGSEINAWSVAPLGSVYDYRNTWNNYLVAPVLSLTSELDIGSGTGTSSSPYQLSVYV